MGWYVETNIDIDSIITLTLTINLHNRYSFNPRLQGNSELRYVPFHNICKHPEYDPYTLKKDFALFRINDVTTINPVKLASNSHFVHSSSEMGVIGFGATEPSGYGNLPPVLQEGKVKPVSQSICSYKWGFDVGHHRVCATGNGEEDVCKGDSGGPLLIDNGNPNYDVQVGVVSFGTIPCNQKYGPPTIYGSVSAVKDWIDSIIKKGSCV